MQLRDIWGSRDMFHYEHPEGGGAPPAPGTGETAPVIPGSSSAGTQTTDPPGNLPETIPYSRFKEVNDARRGLEDELAQYSALEAQGYAAADLQRLAAWESEYGQDPVGTWIRQAGEIEGLPPQVKAAIAEYASGTQGPPGADGGPPDASTLDLEGEDGQPPEWARPLLERHQQDEVAQRQEQISEFYDGLEGVWKELDVQQGLVFAEGHERVGQPTTPPAVMHAFIAAYSPTAADAASLIRTAREAWLAVREEVLQSEIKLPGNTAPRSVPGGGDGSAPPLRPRTLQEARKLAAADPRFR